MKMKTVRKKNAGRHPCRAGAGHRASTEVILAALCRKVKTNWPDNLTVRVGGFRLGHVEHPPGFVLANEHEEAMWFSETKFEQWLEAFFRNEF